MNTKQDKGEKKDNENNEDRLNKKNIWAYIENVNRNIVDLPKIFFLLIILLSLYFFGPKFISKMKDLGMCSFSISGAAMVFQDSGLKFSVITLHSNEYWKDTGITLMPGKKITIKASGTISTGTAFTPARMQYALKQIIEPPSNQLNHIYTSQENLCSKTIGGKLKTIEEKLNIIEGILEIKENLCLKTIEEKFKTIEKKFKTIEKNLWFKTDYNIGFRYPDGKSVNNAYVVLNKSEKVLVQEISDAMRIRPDLEYGFLLATILPDDKSFDSKFMELKKKPWEVASEENIFEIGMKKEIKVKALDRGEIQPIILNKKLFVPKATGAKIVFIVNDCVVPYIEDIVNNKDNILNDPEKIFDRVIEYMIENERIREDIKKDEDNYKEAKGFLGPSFQVAYKIDHFYFNSKQKKTLGEKKPEYGARDLYYLNNQGHLLIIVEEK